MIYALVKPIKAIWKNKNHDVPITIIKIYMDGDKVFFGIKNSSTCIPREEVEFEEGQPPINIAS